MTIEDRHAEHLSEGDRSMASALLAAVARVIDTAVSQVEQGHGPSGGGS
ncbi:MAG: hypothetical protein ACRDYX_12225 [Egibacteraceae bacterium]